MARKENIFLRILRWGWRGIEVWSVLSALGIVAVLKPVFRGVTAGWAWDDQALLFGGIFVLLLGVLALFTPVIKKWISNTAQDKTARASIATDSITTVNGIMHYHNRSKLPRDFGEFILIKDASVLWFTGEAARARQIHTSGKIKRLLVTDPKCVDEPEFLSYLKNKGGDRAPDRVKQQIKYVSEEAHKAGMKVRWLGRIPTVLFVIHNPSGNDAWVRMEILDLNKDTMEWESYKIYKARHEWLFNKLKEYYESLWNDSREVKDDDFE